MPPVPPFDTLILTLRGNKVILDADLASIYGVATKRLNEAIKRNAERFPEDFMFRLSDSEWRGLKSQFVTSSAKNFDNEEVEDDRSQIATLNTGRGRHRKYFPCAAWPG